MQDKISKGREAVDIYLQSFPSYGLPPVLSSLQ